MGKQYNVSSSEVADLSALASYYQQHLLCPYSFNKLFDQFVKKRNTIFHFEMVSILIRPGIERSFCVLCLLCL